MYESDEIAIAKEREKTYRFLSGLCLNPPSDSLLTMIKNRSILLLFEGEGAEKSCKEIARFIDEASGIENLSDELSAEHTALFILPSDFIPHEAVYLDKEKRLGGRVTMRVRQFYESAGADILEQCQEMPDHIGLELEFMAFLCRMEKELREAGDSESLNKCIHLQKAFLNEHLLKWGYQCCEKIIERANLGFYKAAAYLAIDFMKSEEEQIAELYVNA